jgi:hypothetical protein
MAAALTWLGFSALLAAPVLTLLCLGARWKWFGLGILSWVIGVVVKALLQWAWDAAGGSSLPWSGQAAVAGVLSAVTELGAAACFLWGAKLRLADVLAFGVGIGVFEALFVLLLGWLEGLDGPAVSPGNRLAFVGGFFLLERVLALIGHTASRVLLYVGLREKWLLPAVLAVVLFSAVDGTTSYGVLAKWDWEDPTLLPHFYLFVAAVGGLEVAAAWWFGRRVPAWSQTTEPRCCT